MHIVNIFSLSLSVLFWFVFLGIMCTLLDSREGNALGVKLPAASVLCAGCFERAKRPL